MIVVSRISKSFGEAMAVDSVSFEVPPCESVAILGPSGSGKTTLLRLIAGLELPHAGEVYIDGALVSKPGWGLAPHLRSIGFVFQSPTLWPHMTVAQNILYGLHRVPGDEARSKLRELLRQMSLSGLEGRRPDQLSGGEARRVALARALAPEPRRLLMDEPLTNIDPDLKARLLDLIKDAVARTKACLVYVTHDENEAGELSERVLRLRNGRLEM